MLGDILSFWVASPEKKVPCRIGSQSQFSKSDSLDCEFVISGVVRSVSFCL